MSAEKKPESFNDYFDDSELLRRQLAELDSTLVETRNWATAMVIVWAITISVIFWRAFL